MKRSSTWAATRSTLRSSSAARMCRLFGTDDITLKANGKLVDWQIDNGSSALVPYEEIKQTITPESVLPFKLTGGQKDALREIVDAFVVAWERGDVEAVAAMLAQEAIIAMPPMPTWYRGRDTVAAFLKRYPLAPGMRWSDSARLVSGNLPISSAEMASTTPWAFFLMSNDWRKEARMPVTVSAPEVWPMARTAGRARRTASGPGTSVT